MKRRDFVGKTMIAGGMMAPAAGLMSPGPQGRPVPPDEEIVIERAVAGRPHEGKVLAVIQPHCDDIAYFAAGTVAKLIHEGYTAYLIRTTNDDAAGSGSSYGERVLNNEKSNEAFARVMGFKKVYDLGYRNHRMDEYNIQEIKGRLIFLFRLLKVDTIVSFDPWDHYEENPDHYVTARAVEAARWMAGMGTDYPEQLEVVDPHPVIERYYYARGPQVFNRIVDISGFIDRKTEANMAVIAQGSGGHAGSNLRKRLAAEGKKLPLLGNDDRTADFNYIKNFMLDMYSEQMRGIPSDRELGKYYGLEWAERFRYFGPQKSGLNDYISKNAVKL
ncbi:MAG TPA: PIG-L family deacetylase [Bacteroidales bacterium]|nr:PIG-L family deacetylase [Bacteroidales bacterium]HOS73398.1 PIG-L family deacetylase [Bacteroidales bacterium]HQH24826.1 PIG-L family deacetylase [Bacteroidales bacterium]